MKKYCIVCGTENFSRSKNFCCEKCHQKYYYQKNKEELQKKHIEYYNQNKETMIENSIKWQKNNPEKYKNKMAKWREDNRDRYNELAKLSYARRKEANNKNG